MAPDTSGSLERLDVLVGEWETNVPGVDAEGRTTFEWLEGGGFLIERSTVDRPDFPNGICVIGATAPDGGLQQHYWPQRYVGELSEDGNTITGRWERGTELGAPLEHSTLGGPGTRSSGSAVDEGRGPAGGVERHRPHARPDS